MHLLIIKAAKLGLVRMANSLAVLDAKTTVNLLAQAHAKMSNTELDKRLLRLEEQLQIGFGERWTPHMEPYQKGLERLVIEQEAL